MLDIHTHLHFSDYDADRDEVIRRAREASIEKMILVGTDLETSRAAVELAERYDFLYASVGIHPHEFTEDVGCKMQDARWIQELREIAKHPKVVAIGECGLDYFTREKQLTINSQQKKNQKDGFLAQIGIAKECRLPVIIHTRPSSGSVDAYEDVFEILRNEPLKAISYPPAGEAGKLKAILHCYQGDTEVTKKFLELPNVFFSFAGSVTYPVKKSLEGTKDDPREVVKLVPSDRLFIETDCPFLSPQPKRGERNEPAFSLFTAEKVAAIKGVSADDIAAAAGRTARSVFGDFEVYCGREE